MRLLDLLRGVRAGRESSRPAASPASEQNWVAHEWGWAWPADRRILYNRASADPDGKPWSEKKKLVWWDETKKQWTGLDTPDCIKERPPTYQPAQDAKGKDTLSGNDPFVMQADGKAWLFAPHGLQEGPLPTHYEPLESVVKNPLYGQQCNPVRIEYSRKRNPMHRPYDDERFPYLLTTYRLTEHHTAGGMSRWLSWLSELQPEMFCEVSPELAAQKGLRNGDWATISTARAAIETRVLVTERIRPLRIGKRTFQQIGLPYHWGSAGRVRGDSANELSNFVGGSECEHHELQGAHRGHRRGTPGARACVLSICTSTAVGRRSPEPNCAIFRKRATRPEGKHHVTAAKTQQGDQT